MVATQAESCVVANRCTTLLVTDVQRHWPTDRCMSFTRGENSEGECHRSLVVAVGFHMFCHLAHVLPGSTCSARLGDVVSDLTPCGACST